MKTLSDAAGRQVVVCRWVENSNGGRRSCPSHRTRVIEPLAARDVGAADAFARPVQLVHDIGAQPVDEGPHEPRRAGGSTRVNGSQGREVVPFACFFGQAPDPVHHRRYEQHLLDVVLLDQLQTQGRVESGHDDRWDAGEQRLRQ